MGLFSIVEFLGAHVFARFLIISHTLKDRLERRLKIKNESSCVKLKHGRVFRLLFYAYRTTRAT